jgi:hypothetical protein
LPDTESKPNPNETTTKPQNNEIKTIINAHKNGKSLKELAKNFGISINAVAAICGELNLDEKQKM